MPVRQKTVRCLAAAMILAALASAHALAKKPQSKERKVAAYMVYQSKSLGIELSGPMHWKVLAEERRFRLFAPDVELSGVTITVSEQPGPLPDVINRTRTALKSLQQGQIFDETPFSSAHPRHTITFSAVDNGQPIIGAMNIMEQQKRVFLVDCEANQKYYKKSEETFERVAASLHEYAKSGKHIAQSGWDIPKGWVKHANSRIKVSAWAPPSWTAEAVYGNLGSAPAVDLLRLRPPDGKKTHSSVTVTVREGSPVEIINWAKDSVLDLPKAKVRDMNMTTVAGDRKAAGMVFTHQGINGPMADTLLMIHSLHRMLLVRCQSDYKHMEKYNNIFNTIAGSAKDFAPPIVMPSASRISAGAWDYLQYQEGFHRRYQEYNMSPANPGTRAYLEQAPWEEVLTQTQLHGYPAYVVRTSYGRVARDDQGQLSYGEPETIAEEAVYVFTDKGLDRLTSYHAPQEHATDGDYLGYQASVLRKYRAMSRAAFAKRLGNVLVPAAPRAGARSPCGGNGYCAVISPKADDPLVGWMSEDLRKKLLFVEDYKDGKLWQTMVFEKGVGLKFVVQQNTAPDLREQFPIRVRELQEVIDR